MGVLLRTAIFFWLFITSQAMLWSQSLREEERELFNLTKVSEFVGEGNAGDLAEQLEKVSEGDLLNFSLFDRLTELGLDKEDEKTWDEFKERSSSLSEAQKLRVNRELKTYLLEQLSFLNHLHVGVKEEELKDFNGMDRRGLMLYFREQVDLKTLRRWVELELFLRKKQGDIERRAKDALRSRFESVLRTLKRHLKFFPDDLNEYFIDDLHHYLVLSFEKIMSERDIEEIQDNMDAERELLLQGLSKSAMDIFSLSKLPSGGIAGRIIDTYEDWSRFDRIHQEGRALLLAQKLLELPPTNRELLPKFLEKELNPDSKFIREVARNKKLKNYLRKMTHEGRSIFLMRIHDHIAFSLIEKRGRVQPWSKSARVSLFYDDNVVRWPDDQVITTGIDGSGVTLGAQVKHSGQPKSGSQWIQSGMFAMMDYFEENFSNREYYLLGYTATRRQMKPAESSLPFTPSLSVHELIMQPINGTTKSLASSTVAARASFFPKRKDILKSLFNGVYTFSQLSLGTTIYHGDHQNDNLNQSKNSLNFSGSYFALGSTPQGERWLFTQTLQSHFAESGTYDYRQLMSSLAHHRSVEQWEIDMQLSYYFKLYGEYTPGVKRMDHNVKLALDGVTPLTEMVDFSMGIAYEYQISDFTFGEFNRYQIKVGLESQF